MRSISILENRIVQKRISCRNCSLENTHFQLLKVKKLPLMPPSMNLLYIAPLPLFVGVFRECGGARCAHNMVPYTECRFQALSIVQQLVLSNGGDDDMGTLLGLMHTAPTTSLELKTHILKFSKDQKNVQVSCNFLRFIRVVRQKKKVHCLMAMVIVHILLYYLSIHFDFQSLLNVLKESHRTRTVFRKVGGFVYVMSVLVSMEGCLADPPRTPWDTGKVIFPDVMQFQNYIRWPQKLPGLHNSQAQVPDKGYNF